MNRKKLLVENPIVAATVNYMTQMHLQNPQTGRRIKATTPLRNPNHPLHNTSVSIFKKIKDKLTPKKKEEPKKQSQSDVDFYKKQFAGRSGKELKEDWWSDMSPEQQAQYLKNNPGSKKAQDAKKEKGDDKPKYEPSADDYDAIYGTRSQSGGWQKPRDDKPNADGDNAKKTDDMQADVGKKYGVSAMDIYDNAQEPEDFDSWDEYESHLGDVAKKLKDKGHSDAWAADDEADDMKWDDAQDEKDAEDRKDAGITPIKADADTKRMGDNIQRKIGGSKDPDRLELQGTQEASNGETIIQWKDKDDGMMVGVDAQGNIYEDGEKQAYGVDVSTESDVFGDDQNAQLLYKQKRARETGGTDPFTGEKYPKPARTGKELSRKEAKQFIRRNKMKISEDIIRKVIRQEIKSIMKEDDEAFSQPIPAQIDRYMKKFIDAVKRGNLNRKRKLAILGRTIVALRLDPSEVSKYARLVKREL